MVARVKQPAPQPERPQPDPLLIVLVSKDGALISQTTAESPEAAPETACRMLVRRPRLDPGDVMKVLRPMADADTPHSPRNTD